MVLKIKNIDQTTPAISIEELDVKIERSPTELDEASDTFFRYKTPFFHATATIRLRPLGKNECWRIGWIQACTKMDFINTYGDSGHSSWEFPDLLNNRLSMISDSDGKNFPWYGGMNETTAQIKGPTTAESTHTVSMNDNFCPRITWDIPVSNHNNNNNNSDQSSKQRLTNVKRDQVFLTWLVAMDVTNGHYIVLKTFRWRMCLEIVVEPLRELGERARLVSSVEQEQPQLLEHNVEIPNCALYPSNANGSQVMVWRGRDTDPFIVVAPRYFQLHFCELLNSCKDPREFSLENYKS